MEAAAARPVGSLPDQWLARTGAQHYLPHLLADVLRAATGADAGLAVPNFHGIQAPVDGAIAALGRGPVSELDVLRLVAAPDFDLHVVELEGGELEAATATSGAHGAAGGTVGIMPRSSSAGSAGSSTPTARASRPRTPSSSESPESTTTVVSTVRPLSSTTQAPA